MKTCPAAPDIGTAVRVWVTDATVHFGTGKDTMPAARAGLDRKSMQSHEVYLVGKFAGCAAPTGLTANCCGFPHAEARG